jgi:hypothetical protein
MPEPDSREPWFFCEAHGREDIVDRVVTIFADSLDAALDERAGSGTPVERTHLGLGHQLAAVHAGTDPD